MQQQQPTVQAQPKLEQFNGNQAIVLAGTVGADGIVMSGQVVDSTFVFSFTKN